MSTLPSWRRNARRFWERARSDPGLGRNLVVIAILVVLGVGVGGYFLSHERFNPPWEDKRTIYATFDEAPAISPGNGQEVRISGVPVGDIRAASVSNNGKALLKMRIDNRYIVYDNARVVLRPKSPLNEMYIELNPGGPPGHRLHPDATLPVRNTVRPVQVDEVLGRLDGRTRSALTTLLSESDVALANAPAQLPGGLQESHKALSDLQPVMSELDKRRAALSRLVSSVSQISSAAGGNDERLLHLAASLRDTLHSVAGGDRQLDSALAQLPDLSTQLRESTGSVTEMTKQLNPTLDDVRNASGQLPGALSRFDKSVGTLDTTLDYARPVLQKAGPVVGDLRPAVTDLNHTLGDLSPITQRLDPITSGLLPYLNDLQAFVYNTNSVASVSDGSRGILRGQVNVTPESLAPPGLGALPTPNSH